jgi:phosphate transport system substrate-binding protein
MDTQNPPVGPPAGPPKRLFSVRRIAVIAAIGVVAGVLIYLSPRFFNREEKGPEYPRLQVGGTSTVFVVVENRWKAQYRDAKGVQLEYDSTGSTAGVNHLLDGTYSIAFTHGGLTAEQRQKAREKGGDVVHIPVVLFGVAPVYNLRELKGKPPLNLTGELLADVYLGKITQWDHPALRAINPGVPLPPTPIRVVHREESSGTTLVFSEYLDAVSGGEKGEWRQRVGKPAAEVKWPVGVAAARNLGVATKVYETEGAIGYVDRMFTSYDDMVLDYAAVQNKDKSGFVRAEPETLTAAAASVLPTVPDDLVFDLANKPGKDAYPISGVVYAVCFQTQPAATRQRVVEFLHWATHEGQQQAAKMAYAPLPPELVKRVEQKLETIKAAP